MKFEFLIFFFVIPFLVALSPGAVVAIEIRRVVGIGWYKSKPVALYGLLYLGLLCWSYYSVWSLMYGPMSKEDWGPGIVTAFGLVLFQLAPLVLTVPLAIYIVHRHKNNKLLKHRCGHDVASTGRRSAAAV